MGMDQARRAFCRKHTEWWDWSKSSVLAGSGNFSDFLSNIAVAPLVQMDPLVCGIIWYFGSLLGWNPWFNSEFTSADHRTTIGIAWLMPNVDSKRYSCILSLSAQTEFTWELARFLFCFICTSGPSTTFWHLQCYCVQLHMNVQFSGCL